MTNALSSELKFSNLSIKDLIEAREMFHVHLMNKKNVVATAIGRYRIRCDEPWPNDKKRYSLYRGKSHKASKRLDNTEVRDYSWPCIPRALPDRVLYRQRLRQDPPRVVRFQAHRQMDREVSHVVG